jgi:hypothetical protein
MITSVSGGSTFMTQIDLLYIALALEVSAKSQKTRPIFPSQFLTKDSLLLSRSAQLVAPPAAL